MSAAGSARAPHAAQKVAVSPIDRAGRLRTRSHRPSPGPFPELPSTYRQNPAATTERRGDCLPAERRTLEGVAPVDDTIRQSMRQGDSMQGPEQFATKGVNGTIFVRPDRIVLRRKSGLLAIMSQGLKRTTEKAIPIDQVAGVQLKPATAFVNGYVRLSVLGEDRARRRRPRRRPGREHRHVHAEAAAGVRVGEGAHRPQPRGSARGHSGDARVTPARASVPAGLATELRRVARAAELR